MTEKRGEGSTDPVQISRLVAGSATSGRILLKPQTPQKVNLSSTGTSSTGTNKSDRNIYKPALKLGPVYSALEMQKVGSGSGKILKKGSSADSHQHVHPKTKIKKRVKVPRGPSLVDRLSSAIIIFCIDAVVFLITLIGKFLFFVADSFYELILISLRLLCFACGIKSDSRFLRLFAENKVIRGGIGFVGLAAFFLIMAQGYISEHYTYGGRVNPWYSELIDVNEILGNEETSVSEELVPLSFLDLELNTYRQEQLKLEQNINRNKHEVRNREFLQKLIDYVTHIVENYGRRNLNSKQLAYIIVDEALAANFDPIFVASVIKTESAFNRRAISPVGATGLMQIMPGTHEHILTFEQFRGVVMQSLFEARYNVRLGIAYLQYLEGMYRGNRILMLAAYNWGPGHVNQALQNRRGVPRSVLGYASGILKDHAKWLTRFREQLDH